VSNIVCVATTWVSDVVCVTWTWITRAVCVVWDVIKKVGKFIWEKIIRPVVNWVAEAFGICTKRRKILDLTRLQPNYSDENALNFKKDGKRTILCLDGGGVRGIVTLHALKALEEKHNSRCLDMFDMFSGTSTGAIIAGALAWGISVDDLIQLYRDKYKIIFTKSKRRILGGIAGGIIGGAAGAGVGILLGPVGSAIAAGAGVIGGAIAGTKMILPWYDNKAILCILNSIFEDETLAHCYKDILITSKDTVRNETTFFTAFHPEPWSGTKDQSSWLETVRGTYKDVSIASAIAASAASAPLYFKSIGRFIDGGVGSFNNVSYAAPIEALRYSGEYEIENTQLYEEGEVKVLSFGTGSAPTQMETGQAKGIKTPIGWLSWIIPAIMDDADEQQTYIANKELCEKQKSIDYQRFQLYWTEKTNRELKATIAYVNNNTPTENHLNFEDFENDLHSVKLGLDAVKHFDLLDKAGQAFGKWLNLPEDNSRFDQAEEAEEEGEGVITLGNPIDADIYHISVYSADVKSELSDEV
jgi:hypothetical protein